MELKKFSSALFGFKRRQVTDYILEQNALYTAEYEKLRFESQQQIGSLSGQVSALSEKNGTLHRNNCILTDEVNRLKGVNANLDGRCSALEGELKSTLEQRDKLNTDLNQSVAENTLLTDRCKDLETSSAQLSGKLSETETALLETQKRLQSAQDDLKIIALEYSRMKKRLKQKDTESSLQRDVLLKTISEIQSENCRLNEQIAQEKSDAINLESEFTAENVRNEIALALSEIAEKIRNDSPVYGENFVNIG